MNTLVACANPYCTQHRIPVWGTSTVCGTCQQPTEFHSYEEDS